jgi:hypothetical protein
MSATVTNQQTSGQRASGFGATERRDNWWIGPLATAVGLGAFGLYSTFRAIYNAEYVLGIDPLFHVGVGKPTEHMLDHSHLLSPFYSPLLILPFLPVWLSPAFMILWAPGGFRLTCYYYRKAYYRAFFADPPACSVGEPRNQYAGERGLFLFQNIHRFFLYLALAFLVLLSYDVVLSCIWPTDDGGRTFGISVSSLVLAANVTLLSLYTLGCHSLRHLVGGGVDCYSCVAFGDARHKAWKGVSVLNRKHMRFAWLSLFSVGFADFYVWMVYKGVFPDPALFTF